MAKSLCKYRRVEIAEQIAAITDIVSAPEYICSSCARAAADKAFLCKPVAITLNGGKPANKSKNKISTEASIADPVSEHLDQIKWSKLGKKETRKLKKLARKKTKKFKQAAKALKRYNAAVKKAKAK